MWTFVLSVAANPVVARTSAEIEAAKEAALHQLDLQLQLPTADSEKDWPWRLNIPPEFLLLALLLGLAVIAYQFKDMIPIGRRSREPWDEAPAAGDAIAEPATVTALAAADELAGQGRFVDAMHLLLLQGLAAIRERLDEPFADSLTSREILRSTRLSESGKVSLREIVARVEWSYFGKYPAERSDYEACRERFDALAQALRQEIAA